MPFPSSIDLDSLTGATGFTFNGTNDGDGVGHSVSSAGDVNGDGFADIVIASYIKPSPGTGDAHVLEAYVVFGSDQGFSASLDRGDLNGTNGFMIFNLGEEEGFTFFDPVASAIDVAAAGDLNGDGIDDLAIGVFSIDEIGFRTGGKTYVVFGRQDGFAAQVDGELLDGANGFIITGEDFGDGAGGSVAAAGDVNDDGIADLLIGAIGASGPSMFESPEGAAYVVYGSSSGFDASLGVETLDGSNGFKLGGLNGGDRVGKDVSGAGDVNGDGIADFLIGAHLANADGTTDAGETYVVFGSKSGFPADFALHSLDGTNGFRLDGEGEGDFSGWQVASIGDFNGDGLADMVVGAIFAEPGAADESQNGAVYVVFGRDDGFASDLDLADLDGTDGFRIDGEDIDDCLGFAVASAGDVDGDGYSDLLITASGRGTGKYDHAGTAYVVFGSGDDFGDTLDLGLLNGANGFRVDGKSNGDTLGFSASAAGDINDDGFDDIIIGAPGVNDFSAGLSEDTGAAYVLFGRQSAVDFKFGTIERVNTSSVGAEANNLTFGSAFSPNGALIAFNSAADNLVLSDTNGITDIFIKDLTDGSIRRVSTSSTFQQADGDSSEAVFSPDGTRIAFTSFASNLVAGDTNSNRDIFVKDLGSGAVIRVSTGANGSEGDGFSFVPVFSPDGKKVAFVSSSTNLVPGDTNGVADLFIKDLDTGEIARVSTDASGLQANGASFSFDTAFSPDGSKVAFTSNASNLVPNDTNGTRDIFIKDLFDGSIVRVSTDSSGNQIDASSSFTGFSPDGNRIVFSSDASSLVVGDDNGTFDIFVKDLVSGDVTLVSSGTGGVIGDEGDGDGSYGGYFTPDGQNVVFSSTSTNFVPNDTNDETDVFLKSLVTGEIIRLSSTGTGLQANDNSGNVTVSPNGAQFAFFSYASNLVPTDNNATSDIFVVTLADTLNIKPSTVDDVTLFDGKSSVVIDVLANDSDPDGDTLTIQLVTLPGGGSAVVNQDNTITYAPGDGFDGDDGFYYVVSDGNGAIGSAWVTVSAQAPTVDLGNLLVFQGITVRGAGIADLVGKSVSGAGDVNNDGIDDYLLAAFRSPSQGGQVYVLFGSEDEDREIIDLANFSAEDGFIAVGAQASLEFTGGSISEAGDVNNDGIDDFLIAARNNDDAGAQAGKVYLVFGKSGAMRGNIDLTALTGTDGFSILGDLPGDEIGRSVSSAGDVNNDGIADIIIGTPDGGDSGTAYVVYGTDGATRPDLDLSDFTAADGFVISGVAFQDQAGISVSGGDVNGDGISDLIVGAAMADSSAQNAGQVYIVYGIDAATRGDVDLGTLGAADGFSILGAAGADSLGVSVSFAGDVNGDGVNDLVVSAPYGDGGGTQSGEVYVVYGKPGGTRADVDLANLMPADGFRIIGDAGADFLGMSVSSAGDVDGDGYDDLIMGAPNADGGGGEAGEAYLIFGSGEARGEIDLSNLTRADGVIFLGHQAGGAAGDGVSGAGDINNDGFDDIIIGANQIGSSGQATGEAYIIYGRTDFTFQPNIAPVALDDTATLDEDSSVVIDVLTNDTDVDGDALTASLLAGPANGSVLGNGDGSFTYTPDPDFAGTDSFTYTISDGNGGTDTATVTITINPVNDAPLAGDDTISVASDTIRTIDAATLLANDSDIDGDALTITSVQGAVNGTVALDGTTVTFTPEAGFTGAASFTYTVSDGNGGSDTASVAVTVTEGNQPPVAPATQAATTLRGAAILVEVGASDPDGDVLGYGVSGAVNGTASVDEDGLVTYTPDAGFTGSETLVVTIDDGNGGFASQEIVLTVSALPAANQFRLFASDGFAGAIGGSGAVIGTGGFQDIAVLDVAGTVSFDPSFNQGDDIVRLSGDADDWYVSKSGSSAIFTDGDTFVQLAVGPAGMAVVFDDGARTLRLDVGGGGAFLIGDQVFTATLARVDAAPDGTVLPGGADAQASARLFLAEDGGASAAGKVNVIGTGGAEIATLLSGTITLDPSFNKGGDVIRVDEAAEDFLASKSGSSALLVGSDTTLLVPVGLAGATLAFGDGSDTRELLLSIEPNGITIDEQFFGVDPMRLMAAV